MTVEVGVRRLPGSDLALPLPAYATEGAAGMDVCANLAASDRTDGLVILDFTASWCGPCQQMRPAVEKLVEKHYPVRQVDFDAQKGLVRKYHVTAVPTFVVVAPDGRELGRLEGFRPARDIAELYREAQTNLEDGDDNDDVPQRPIAKPAAARRSGRRSGSSGTHTSPAWC